MVGLASIAGPETVAGVVLIIPDLDPVACTEESARAARGHGCVTAQ
jgi:hypothetical protein